MKNIIDLIAKDFTYTGNPVFDFIIVSFILSMNYVISFKITGFFAESLDYNSSKMSAFHWTLRIFLTIVFSVFSMAFHIVSYIFLACGSLLIVYKFIRKMKNIF